MLTCCKERILVCYLANHSQMGGKLNRMGFWGGQLGRMVYIQYMPHVDTKAHLQEQHSALESNLGITVLNSFPRGHRSREGTSRAVLCLEFVRTLHLIEK